MKAQVRAFLPEGTAGPEGTSFGLGAVERGRVLEWVQGRGGGQGGRQRPDCGAWDRSQGSGFRQGNPWGPGVPDVVT